MKYTIDEIKDILECAIGEVDAYIPPDVIKDTIDYLTEYENMRARESYDKYPDGFY